MDCIREKIIVKEMIVYNFERKNQREDYLGTKSYRDSRGMHIPFKRSSEGRELRHQAVITPKGLCEKPNSEFCGRLPIKVCRNIVAPRMWSG
jgi:hypothetical protein